MDEHEKAVLTKSLRTLMLGASQAEALIATMEQTENGLEQLIAVCDRNARLAKEIRRAVEMSVGAAHLLESIQQKRREEAPRISPMVKAKPRLFLVKIPRE